MSAELDLDAIRAALAVATPAPWAEGYVQWAVRHIARNCDYEPADESEPDFCWDRYNDWPVIANAPVWLAQLADEVERLKALIASKTMATFEWALEQKTMRAERDEQKLVVAGVTRLMEEMRAQRDAALGFQNALSDQLTAALDDRAAALAECERLRARLREEMGVES